MTQVFISYSRKDLIFVEHLAKDLKAAGLEVWYDLSGLETGIHWGMEIQAAIQKSQYIIIVLSPNSIASEWVEREFIYASNHKLKTIPLIYKPCDLPLWSVSMHYIDMQGKNYKRHFGELLKVLGVRAEGAARKVEPVAEVPPVQAILEKQEPLEIKVGQEEIEPLSLPIAQKIEEKAKSGTADDAVPPKTSPRKIKIRLAWIITPVAVLAIVAVITLLVLNANGKLGPAKPYVSAVPARTSIPTETQAATITPVPTPAPQPTDTSVPPATDTLSPTLEIGSTWTSPVDGMVMVYIPEGNFTMGRNAIYDSDEKPLHMVYQDAFWIDRTEVTNAMYRLCVEAGACLAPQFNGMTGSTYYGDPNYDDYAANYIDWNMASAYCAWAEGRLPTEAEWEKAARGVVESTYPWGNNEPDCTIVNFYGCFGSTRPVGRYPDGASPYGVLDMAGNVAEWVSDYYSETYYSQSPDRNPQGPSSGQERAMRGGSWASIDWYITVTNRSGSRPDGVNGYQGFRCARSITP